MHTARCSLLTTRRRVSQGLVVALAAFVLASSAAAQDDPHGDSPDLDEGVALVRQEAFDRAIPIFRAVLEEDPDNDAAWFYLGYSLHAQGKLDAALEAHLEATDSEQFGPIAMYNVACVHSLKGDVDAAFEWLKKAHDAGFRNARQLRIDPDMDNIRDDPRFNEYVRSAGPRPVGGGVPVGRRRSTERGAEVRRQFDFWVGEWDVFNPQGALVGTNRIESLQNGNLLLEHWRGEKGSDGKSLNFYDPAKEKWVQVWVDNSGGVIVGEGGLEDGAMSFAGTHVLPTGERRPFRFTFTPQDAAAVRQFIEESADGGETWKTWFEGVYRPQKQTDDDAAPDDADADTTTPGEAGDSAKEDKPAPFAGQRRQLDFWVGEWNVVDPAGQHVGTNRITRELDGHLIVEHWTVPSGQGGRSFSFFDPHEEQWVQVWVDSAGGCTYKAGALNDDGAMVMTGERILPDGRRIKLRSTLTPADDGTVHQLLEQSPDDGATWTTWFDGIYKPKK